jgi:predicted DNA-binding transcriptional regulator AlpA
MRMLRYWELKAKGIGFSRDQIRRKEADGSFPMHVDLGEASIAWPEPEIDGYLAECVAERDRKLAERRAAESQQSQEAENSV